MLLNNTTSNNTMIHDNISTTTQQQKQQNNPVIERVIPLPCVLIGKEYIALEAEEEKINILL